MWIVRLALRRPYTFVVMSLMIALAGGLAIVRMPTDIFPEISIPIVNVIWNYNGISAEEMAKRIITPIERGLTTSVNDIEHMESQSVNGVGVMKISFIRMPGLKPVWRRSRLPRNRFCESCRPVFFLRSCCAITRPACPSCK